MYPGGPEGGYPGYGYSQSPESAYPPASPKKRRGLVASIALAAVVAGGAAGCQNREAIGGFIAGNGSEQPVAAGAANTESPTTASTTEAPSPATSTTEAPTPAKPVTVTETLGPTHIPTETATATVTKTITAKPPAPKWPKISTRDNIGTIAYKEGAFRFICRNGSDSMEVFITSPDLDIGKASRGADVWGETTTRICGDGKIDNNDIPVLTQLSKTHEYHQIP